MRGLPDRYKNFPITIAGPDHPIYNSGLTVNSFRKSAQSTKGLSGNTDGEMNQDKLGQDESGRPPLHPKRK